MGESIVIISEVEMSNNFLANRKRWLHFSLKVLYHSSLANHTKEIELGKNEEECIEIKLLENWWIREYI